MPSWTSTSHLRTTPADSPSGSGSPPTGSRRGRQIGIGWAGPTILHAGTEEQKERYLLAPALTVGGGSGDVQRTIVAERVLGLPHDVDVEAGKSWAEAERS